MDSLILKYKYIILALFIILGLFFVYEYISFKNDISKTNEIKHKKIIIGASLSMKDNFDRELERSGRIAFDEYVDSHPNSNFEFLVLDDSGESSFDENKLKSNVNSLIENKDVIAIFGPSVSLAAKQILPITNAAGILVFSPTNSWPGLTKPGYKIDEPIRFYPTGIRTYARLSPTDELEVSSASKLASSIGFKKIILVDDATLDYGLSILFEKNSSAAGLDSTRIVLTKDNINEVVEEILNNNPGVIYYNGLNGDYFENLVKELTLKKYKGKYMCSDSLLDGTGVLNNISKELEGTYVTSVSIPLDKLNNQEADRFMNTYKSKYGTNPGIYGGLAYETMHILLNSIEKSDRTRMDVIKKVLSTSNFPSMFGSISIDANGDNVNVMSTKNIIHNGKVEFIGVMNQTGILLK